MYEQYYGLRERAFDLSPNPRFLFLSRSHREALTHLRYGLGRSGITVLVGEAGTGKTTLVRAALQAAGADARTIVHLSNPTLTRIEFFEYLASGFGFGAGAAASKSTFLRHLEASLAESARAGHMLALMVDEAQSLPHELLEEIRLLTNTEGAGQSLAVVLVGQPELADRLNDARLRQLKQRVALRCELATLSLAETDAYVSARIAIAGGPAEMLFTPEAIVAIHAHSRGIARIVSVICDNALVNGFAADVRPVGPEIILEVCRDFALDQSPALGGAVAKVAGGGAAPSGSTAAPPNAAITAPRHEARQPHREPMFSRIAPPRRFSFF